MIKDLLTRLFHSEESSATVSAPSSVWTDVDRYGDTYRVRKDDLKVIASTREQYGYMFVVKVDLEDGSREVVFNFYPDEIWINEHELIGMTFAQAKDYKKIKEQSLKF